MNIFTVSFFGHREISDSIKAEEKLSNLINELIHTKEYVEFLVGRNGSFDLLVSSVIRKITNECDYGNFSHTLVLPDQTVEYCNNSESFNTYYSEVEICEKSSSAHFKSAIQIRNKSMVDRSDLVICYIERKNGGAYKTLQYANDQKKIIINLADR